jgi:hypothetical protein
VSPYLEYATDLEQGKYQGLHYTPFSTAHYAWRIQKPRSTPEIRPKILAISSKLRNLG